MENEKLVLVATYGTRAEADLAKGALEDEGFPAMVQADTAGKMREHLAWSGPGVRRWQTNYEFGYLQQSCQADADRIWAVFTRDSHPYTKLLRESRRTVRVITPL